MAPARKATRTSPASNSKEHTPKAFTKTITMITQRQKQALMDNLQLEITERARKLRAQYALQCQSLHTRIELRVNRVPTSLRKITVGELIDRHSADRVQKPVLYRPVDPQAKAIMDKVQRPVTAPAAIPRGTKRTSAHMENDKENTPDPTHIVANPKKRAKATGDRRVPDPATVLSPKSSNSRNIPQSPTRNQWGAQKTTVPSRPASPLKPASPVKAIAPAANARARTNKPTANTGSVRSRTVAKSTAIETKPYAARTKRGLTVTGDRAVSSASSNTSGLSGTSASTTIVKKVGRAPGTTGTMAAKRAAGTTASATMRKATASATQIATAPAGRRTLRKRT